MPDVLIQPAAYVTLNLMSRLIGKTPKSLRKQIESGSWLEGREYRRGPDGRIWCDTSCLNGRGALDIKSNPPLPITQSLSHMDDAPSDKGTALAAILDAAQSADSVLAMCGVYFLLHGKEVVYVGQSRNLMSRLVRHREDGIKTFDRISWLPLSPQDLNKVERQFIEMFKPKYNVAGNA